MARTKQTARRSTGGMAPRRQWAYSSSSDDDKNPFAGDPQLTIFKESRTRSIVVEGTAELNEVPDIVHLSFLINETGATLEDGIKRVLQEIAQVRTIATTECGISNANISSDSIGSKSIRTEVGYYVPSKKKPKDADSEDEDDDNGRRVFRVHETKVHYEVRSVVRITLEEADMVDKNFSKLCYKIMSKANLRTHEAPVYELSKITRLRNLARTEACKNAKEKAAAIVEALGDATIQLGPPICLTDIFVNLCSDADSSFLGNWSSLLENREIIPRPPQDDKSTDSKKDEVDGVQSLKRAKTEPGTTGDEKMVEKEDSAPNLDETVMEQLFVVPSIRVAARIQVIFEVSTQSK